MPPDLHVDTTVLRGARASVGALCATLQPRALDAAELAVLAAAPGGAVLVAEHDRLLAGLYRTTRELADLEAALGIAAATLETAEWHAVRFLTAGER